MPRFILGLAAGILFLAVLAVIGNATNVGEIFLSATPDNIFFQQPSGFYLQQRLAMIDELNKYRARNGLSQLQPHPYLMQTAQWWSGVQAFHGEGGHPEAVNQRYLKNYRDPVKASRMFCRNGQNSGQTPVSFGINSAARQEIYAWQKSPGHDKTQRGNWKYVGAGIAVGPCGFTSGNCYYSTMDFGG